MRKPHTLLLPLLLAAPVAWADSCDTIRADIEAKLRAAGVVSYTLLTVGVADTLPGKVVGSCSLGKKKIIYQVPGGDTTGLPAAGPSTSQGSVVSTQQVGAQGSRPGTVITSTQAPPKGSPVPRAPTKDLITECKDGSMSVGGECKP